VLHVIFIRKGDNVTTLGEHTTHNVHGCRRFIISKATNQLQGRFTRGIIYVIRHRYVVKAVPVVDFVIRLATNLEYELFYRTQVDGIFLYVFVIVTLFHFKEIGTVGQLRIATFRNFKIGSLRGITINACLTYFLFVKKKEAPKGKFTKWLKDFLAFKIMWLEPILKMLYYILTIGCILVSFGFLGYGGAGVLMFFMTLIGGPILIRLGYEMTMMFIMIWRNTRDIAESTAKKK
jgi:hypothetical protein